MVTARSTQALNDGWRFAYSMTAPETSLRSSDALRSAGLTLFPCELPASLYLDLHRQGLVDDPRDITNLPDFAPYEYAHVWYVCRFQGDAAPDDATAWLAFQRIDCYAEVYLNGLHIGSTDNALIPHKLPAEGMVSGENELVVHIRPAMVEAQKYDYPPGLLAPNDCCESLYARRLVTSYGQAWWPRNLSPSMGRVSLETVFGDNLGRSWLNTLRLSRHLDRADLALYLDLDLAHLPLSSYEVGLEMRCVDSVFAETWPATFSASCHEFYLRSPLLWWPRGHGEPQLYDCRLTLLRDGQVVDERKLGHGIRTVSMTLPPDAEAAEQGPQLIVNWRPIYMQGAMWVGDGSGDEQRTQELVKHVVALGCNLVRCGSIAGYASDALLDACDRAGILVWQDVALYGATHPQTESFLTAVAEEIGSVARRLRLHASVALWTGGVLPECPDRGADDRFPDASRLLPAHDPLVKVVRQSLASELPGACYADLLADHMPMRYYRTSQLRKTDRSLVPYVGCSDPKLAARLDDETREHYLHWWLHILHSVPGDPKSFCLGTQIEQAETLKRHIESARSEPRTHGHVWRYLADDVSMVSPAVLDYRLAPKLAYGYVQRAQQPLLLLFRYARAYDHEFELWASSHLDRDEPITYWVTDVETDEILIDGESTIPSHEGVALGELMASTQPRCLLIEWRDEAGRLYRNHHLQRPLFTLDQYRRWMALIDEK